MIKKKDTLWNFCLEWLQKKIIEITTYCDEKKGMFDKTKKKENVKKKKIENIPNFFFQNTGLNPQNKNKKNYWREYWHVGILLLHYTLH